jgi:glycosyltransferase involved in cell wall biosynthesis
VNSITTHFSPFFGQQGKLLPHLIARNQNAKVALIGPCESRACGLATFTCDILQYCSAYESEHRFHHIPILRGDERSAAPLRITENVRESYRATARAINEARYDAVWIQHEFGIFGGPDGEWILDFAERVAAPLIITFHTILAAPSPAQKYIITRLAALASRINVMSDHGRNLLIEHYEASPERITLIEHGAPDRPFAHSSSETGTAVTMATFGLIGPGKGLETALDALSKVRQDHPDIKYRIIGATHPVLVAKEGEAYREGLKSQIRRLGLEDNVEWVDRFLDIEELLEELENCQIYLTPYTNLQQTTSGTLSYAVALGKAVISTPYVHARELLGDDCGRLFPVGHSDILAAIIADLADRPAKLLALQQRAYQRGRLTIWPEFVRNVGAMVSDVVIAPQRLVRPDRLSAAPGLTGFFAMIDGTGMFQHSKGLIPDRDHGYCLDDNVRALMLMNLVGNASDAHHYRVMLTLCSFVQHCYNPDNGHLRNFMAYDRRWLEDVGSEDSNGRAIWCFGHSYRYAALTEIRDWGRGWFDRTAHLAASLGSPRAMAFAALGAALVLEGEPAHPTARQMLEKTGSLLFELLKSSTRPDWTWFETVLGYDNPRLPEALMRAGQLLGNSDWIETGVDALRWINKIQSTERALFRPVGSDSFGLEHDYLPFDQQPLEAWSAIDACVTANEISPSPEWAQHARLAMSWFHGGNDRSIALADVATGTCRDGITRQGVNENRGAESILAYQLGFYGYMRLAECNGRDAANDERDEHGIRNAAGHIRSEVDRRPASGGAAPVSPQLAGQ